MAKRPFNDMVAIHVFDAPREPAGVQKELKR